MAFTNNTIACDSPTLWCMLNITTYENLLPLIIPPLQNSTFGSFMQNSLKIILYPMVVGHTYCSSCVVPPTLSNAFAFQSTVHQLPSSNICDTFSTHTSTGFWRPRRETCSRTSAPRPGRCAGAQRWWCACGPVCQRPSSSSLARTNG